MARRVAKKKVAQRANVETSVDRLRKVLAKRTKAELVDLVMDFVDTDRKVLRALEAHFNVEAPTEELVALTKQAIADATDFDESKINYNFDYDHQAYQTVQRNLQRLVDTGQFEEAMELSLELMSQGSYQVEMSDEGMMTDDIEECLQVVVKALKKSDLPAKRCLDWCEAMIKKDCVGYICEDQLNALRQKLRAVS